MPKKKRSILQPEYMSRFRCIGGACEDNCCIGTWNIFVDKKTFLKYRDVKDKELAPVLDQVVKRYRGKGADDQQFAHFRLRADGSGCVFLTGDRFCLLQKKLGYENLCDVCAVYPRLYKMADGKIERCATVSCPEVARLALGNPDGISFETIEEGPDTGRVPARVQAINSRSTRFAARPAKFLWDIRLTCLSILQNRSYPTGQRLILLGMLCSWIEERDKNGRVEEIPAVLEKFNAIVEDGSSRPDLNALQNNFSIQMRLARELTDNRLSMELVTSVTYLDCVKETLAGLGLFVGVAPDDVLKAYMENHETHVAAYLKEKEYVLENFLVNEFFMRMMPFGSGDTVWDSYLFLCVLYGMVKLHLNGMSGFRKGLTDEAVFKMIQSFSKVVLHNTKFIPSMVQMLKDNDFDTLAWMTILVND
jgi:lysine-N-methylase